MDEVVGEGWQRVVHADDLPGALYKCAGGIEPVNPYETQFRLLDKNGDYR